MFDDDDDDDDDVDFVKQYDEGDGCTGNVVGYSMSGIHTGRHLFVIYLY